MPNSSAMACSATERALTPGVADDDVAIGGRVDVDVVEPAAVFGDHLQPVGPFDHVAVERCDPDDHRVVAVDIGQCVVDAVVLVHARARRKLTQRVGADGIDFRRKQHLPRLCHGRLFFSQV